MIHRASILPVTARPWLAVTLVLAVLAGTLVSTLVLAQEVSARLPEQQNGIKTAPVIVDSQTLFLVRGVSAYPAEQRAADIGQRIIEVAKDESFDVDELAVKEEEGLTSIYAGDTRIMSIVDVDAELENLQRSILAMLDRNVIAKSITEYRVERSAAYLTKKAIYAVGATLLLVLLAWSARALFRRLDDWSERHVKKSVDQLADKSHQLVQASAVWAIVAGLLRLVRVVFFLLLMYFYLNTVLGLFPWTRPVALILFQLILTPLASLWNGFTEQVPNLAFLVVLWFVVRYLLKIMRAFFAGIGAGRIKLQNFETEWAEPTFKILRVMTIAFALVIAYPYIPGSGSDAFKGVSLFFGLLLSLGSSSFIANMIAGLTMTYRGAFKAGDRIKVGDVVGSVEDVRLMVTRVRTPKNELVILPNSNILNTEVVNYSQLARKEGIVLHSIVGIGYDTPWRQVEALLLEAAARTNGLKQHPSPFVLQTSLGDFAVNYEVNAYCSEPNRMPAIYSALHANIQDVFNEHGVQIMSPAYEADPATPKIVPPESWYAAPAKKPE